MSHTNVVFFEKRGKTFFKKSLGATEFCKKTAPKIIVDFFVVI
jgi:hypothetical protein